MNEKPHLKAHFNKLKSGNYWRFEHISGPKMQLSRHSKKYLYMPIFKAGHLLGDGEFEALYANDNLYIQKKQNEPINRKKN